LIPLFEVTLSLIVDRLTTPGTLISKSLSLLVCKFYRTNLQQILVNEASHMQFMTNILLTFRKFLMVLMVDVTALLAVLLTFGLAFPPVALVALMGICGSILYFCFIFYAYLFHYICILLYCIALLISLSASFSIFLPLSSSLYLSLVHFLFSASIWFCYYFTYRKVFMCALALARALDFFPRLFIIHQKYLFQDYYNISNRKINFFSINFAFIQFNSMFAAYLGILLNINS